VLSRLTRGSSPTGSQLEELIRREDLLRRLEHGEPSINAKHDGKYALRLLSISLKKVAASVGKGIRAYWNSITSTRLKRQMTSARSWVADTAGAPKPSEPRSESVESFVPTATASIPLSSKSITGTTTSKRPSIDFSEDTISRSRIAEVFEGIMTGTVDYDTVTFREWLEVSFIMLYDTQELHAEVPVIYGGGVYHLHACVEAISPPEKMSGLKEMQ
jgi:hypothetical protein